MWNPSSIKRQWNLIPTTWGIKTIILPTINGGVRISKGKFPPINNVNVGTIQKDQHNTSKSVSEGFVDIPITCELESPRNSIGSSEPTTLLLEKDIGLFRIRPKYLRNLRPLSINPLRSKLNRIKLCSSLNQVKSKARYGNGKLQLTKKNTHTSQDNDLKDSASIKFTEEVEAIMDTSSKLEIHFKGGREAISKSI
ncbi:hypothetical protein GQ457_12G018480 [Hibiscus cannabinus]